MADLQADYRIILEDAYAEKKRNNPRFSLNAFARTLGLNPTYLSKLRSGRILLSLELAAKVTARLKLPPEIRKRFLLSVAEEQRCHALHAIDPSLTECDPAEEAANARPRSRKKD